MKKFKYYIMSFTLLIVLGLTSCKDTYEIHEDYIADGEIIYATKVDSLITLPGNNRLEITGFISNAFNVKEIEVFWNKGEDSQIFPYSKSEDDIDPIQLVIDGLEEKSYEFHVYSKDSDGNTSIKVVTFGTVYGESFRSNLEARGIISFALGSDSNATVTLRPGSEVTKGTEFKFTNLSGGETVTTILADEDTGMLEQVDMTAPVMYRTFYVPTAPDENGNATSIDEFDSDWATYELPSTITSIFTSIVLEPNPGGVIANWENLENNQMTFDFMNLDKQGNEVTENLVSSDSEGTYTFKAMKIEEQDVEIKVSDIYGNSKAVSFTVTPLPAGVGKGDWVLMDFSVEHGSYPATNAIDGDINTFWHTPWGSGDPGYPHHLTIDMGIEKTVSGFEVFRRQGFSDGMTKHKFYVSVDGTNWTDLGEYDMDSSIDEGQVFNVTPVVARYVKYEATEGPGNYTHLGELYVNGSD